MQTAIGRFLRYLTVERNASPLTIKSYREDLTTLADYLQQAYGEAGRDRIEWPVGSARIRRRDARSRIREDVRFAAAGVACEASFDLLNAKGLAANNPGQATAKSAPRSQAAALSRRPKKSADCWRLPRRRRRMGLRDRAILETMYSAGCASAKP